MAMRDITNVQEEEEECELVDDYADEEEMERDVRRLLVHLPDLRERENVTAQEILDSTLRRIEELLLLDRRGRGEAAARAASI